MIVISFSFSAPDPQHSVGTIGSMAVIYYINTELISDTYEYPGGECDLYLYS